MVEFDSIDVTYFGKRYTYSKVGTMITWSDSDGMAIPVMLHSILREKAIATGVDKSIFISKEGDYKVEKATKKSGGVKQVKGTLKGGFNPFK